MLSLHGVASQTYASRPYRLSDLQAWKMTKNKNHQTHLRPWSEDRGRTAWHPVQNRAVSSSDSSRVRHGSPGPSCPNPAAWAGAEGATGTGSDLGAAIHSGNQWPKIDVPVTAGTTNSASARTTGSPLAAASGPRLGLFAVGLEVLVYFSRS